VSEQELSKIPTYDTDTASTALATNTATYSLQDGHTSVKYSTVIPQAWLRICECHVFCDVNGTDGLLWPAIANPKPIRIPITNIILHQLNHTIVHITQWRCFFPLFR